MSLAEWIKEQGRGVGFDRVGIAPATDLPELAHFPDWLERGYAGQMDYLHNANRRDVRQLMPDARSVICCALAYDTERPRSTELPTDSARGWVSRYAWGDDYHTIVRQKLEALRTALAEKVGKGFDSRAYVDTGPVLERVYAHYAGLGWLAKNTCLLDADLGSFFFLGVLITDLELAIDTPPADGCGACTLCLEACPTGALVESYVLDARLCISYLTIELRDAIPEEHRPGMGRHLFGCDICQDVCPYNQRSARTADPAFHPRDDSFFHPPLERLASLTEDDFHRVFKGSPVKRAKRRGLMRNTLVAMGNSGNPAFRPTLERFSASDDPFLADHAHWALNRLPAG